MQALGDEVLIGKSVGRSREYVDIFSADFTTVSGKESDHLLVLSENLLQNFCSSGCNWWCWILGGHYLPYSPDIEILWRVGLQCLL